MPPEAAMTTKRMACSTSYLLEPMRAGKFIYFTEADGVITDVMSFCVEKDIWYTSIRALELSNLEFWNDIRESL